MEFFERGFECGHEILWQIADKADGIGEDCLLKTWKTQASARGVERGKQLIFGIDIGLRERVEESRFAGICIADEAEYGDILGVSAFALEFAMTGAILELASECLHSFACFTAVHFEFCFARASPADAASQTAHGRVLINEFGQIVFELREFDLEFSIE